MEERWRQLMIEAQAGDRESLERLIADTLPIVRSYIGRRLGRWEDVDEVCQAIFERVNKSLTTYDSSRPFRAWLYAIARNCINDHLRSCMLCAASATGEEEDLLMVEGCGLSESALLARAIDSLSEEQQAAFRMINLEGVSIAAAADQSGIAIGAFKGRLHRASQAVRRRLSESA